MDVRGEYVRTLVIIVCCLGVVAGVVAGASTTEVMLSPKDGPVQPGETVEYDVVVEEASGGVGSFNVTVRTNDSSVLEIRNVTYDDSAAYTHDANGSKEVRLAATGMDTLDTGPVTVATVTMEANDVGTARLSISVTALGDEDGDSYTVTDEQDRTLAVEPAPEPTPEPTPAPTPEPTPDDDDDDDGDGANVVESDRGGGGGDDTDAEPTPEDATVTARSTPVPTAEPTAAPTVESTPAATPEPTPETTETAGDVDVTPEPTPDVEAGGFGTRTLALVAFGLLAVVVAVIVLRRQGRL
jgi:hypothetical protein